MAVKTKTPAKKPVKTKVLAKTKLKAGAKKPAQPFKAYGGAYSPSVNVPAAIVDTLLAAANSQRAGIIISNDSTGKLYVLFGSTVASAANFTYVIPAGASLELPNPPAYVGMVRGIWSAANGSAAVTELT